ncbi:MAG TPA: hypothetical protein G4O03_07560 [Dehalococcoidia bacterium]|nr:hypothetical protein [Dehalococcoidia bacterium]
MRKRIKLLFALLALMLLTPWPVAYAYDVSDGMGADGAIQIEAAEPSALPTWSASGKTVGGVTTPGDLFYIDATGYTADIQLTLYLTNAQELVRGYGYLILEVGVYIRNEAGGWEKASGSNGEPIPETFITLRNGQASFTLMGNAEYKVTIDSGCFYSITTDVGGGSLSPRFYLTVA